METRKVAIVTGANRGVGLAVVRSLCKNFDGDVYLTSRNEENGRKAAALLQAEGLHPKVHQLDIACPDSIAAFRQHILEQYGGIDVLVNNAAIAYRADSTVPFIDQAKETVATNFTGSLNLTKAFFPMLRPHARIVMVSSGVSEISLLRKDLQDRFMDPNITEDDVVKLENEFLEAVVAGNLKENGWPKWPNAVSKMGVNALARTYAKDFAKSGKDDILINACCPGWVKTSMGDENSVLTPDEGAETPVYLALLPAGSPTGLFFIEKEIIEWEKVCWKYYDARTYVW